MPGRQGAKMGGADETCLLRKWRVPPVLPGLLETESPGDWGWEYCWDQTFDLLRGRVRALQQTQALLRSAPNLQSQLGLINTDAGDRKSPSAQLHTS